MKTLYLQKKALTQQNIKKNYTQVNSYSEYKNNPTIVQSVNTDILYNTSPKTQNNKDVVLESVRKEPMALIGVSLELKDDKDVVLAAVKRDGAMLYYASLRMQDDKDVVLAAVERDGAMLHHASSRMKRNKDVALAAVKKNPLALKDVDCCMDAKAYKEVVLLAVQKNKEALQYVCEELQNDPIIKFAITHKKNFFLTEYIVKIADNTPSGRYNDINNSSIIERKFKFSIDFTKNENQHYNAPPLVSLFQKHTFVFIQHILPFVNLKDIFNISMCCKNTHFKIIYYTNDYGKTALINSKKHEGIFKLEDKILQVYYEDYMSVSNIPLNSELLGREELETKGDDQLS